MPVNKSNFFNPMSLKTRVKEQDVVSCDQCGCTFMESLCVQQYPKNHSVILGQKPGSVNDIGFWIFRCPKCQEIYEPSLISGGPQDLARKGYDKFLDQMETPLKKPLDSEDV